jgi:hypothetical protein
MKPFGFRIFLRNFFLLSGTCKRFPRTSFSPCIRRNTFERLRRNEESALKPLNAIRCSFKSAERSPVIWWKTYFFQIVKVHPIAGTSKVSSWRFVLIIRTFFRISSIVRSERFCLMKSANRSTRRYLGTLYSCRTIGSCWKKFSAEIIKIHTTSVMKLQLELETIRLE